MELEDARLQLLLGMAFGSRLVEGQAEWRDVPEVVRSSFVLLTKELRRLHRLLLANRQDPAPPLQHESGLQDELAQLKAQVQDAQRQADARHSRTKQTLSSLWGEVAATAQAAADAQTQHTDSWAAAKQQLKILETRMEKQDKRWKRDKKSRTQAQQVDAALHELQKGQVLCSQELRRLKRVFEAHDHQVLGTTLQVRGEDEELRSAEHLEPAEQDKSKTKKGRQRTHDGAVHVLLHQRYVDALKRQQQQDRGSLSTVAEEVASV